MNRLALVLVVCTSLIHAAPSIRMPQMPKQTSGTASVKKRKRTEQTQPRKKRKGVNGLKVYHTFSYMTYEELKEAKDKEKKGNPAAAIKYLEQMIKLSEKNGKDTVPISIEEKAALILELADLHFSQKNFTEAKKRYQEFDRLYQGNKRIEEVKYKIILCAKEGILSYDRDQSATEETLQLCLDYESRSSFTKFKKEVNEIKKDCETILVHAEYNVIGFYINQGSYHAAEKRIKQTDETWSKKVPEAQLKLAQYNVELGSLWKGFKVPEESLKLVQAATPITAPKERSMTTRF